MFRLHASLLPLKEDYGDTSGFFLFLSSRLKTKETAEQIRNFYVAVSPLNVKSIKILVTRSLENFETPTDSW